MKTLHMMKMIKHLKGMKMVSDRMETWSIDKDEDGGYSQSNGKVVKKIFTPVQVAIIKRIIQDNSEETERPARQESE